MQNELRSRNSTSGIPTRKPVQLWTSGIEDDRKWSVRKGKDDTLFDVKPMKESVANDEDFSFWYPILISKTDWRRLRDVFQRWRNNFYSTRVLNCASQNKQNERWLIRMQVTRLQTQAYPKETRHQISKHRWNNTFQNSHIPLYCKTAQRFGKDRLLGYSKVEAHNHEMVQ